MTVTNKDMNRFNALVKRQQGNCWEWIGGKNPNGYGIFRYKNKSTHVHRFSFIAHKGLIPEGLHILHKCDNRSCVNPDHLYAGTHTDNMQDRVARDRHPMAKLSREQTKELIDLYANTDMKHRELAEKFGISEAQVGKIFRASGVQAKRKSNKRWTKTEIDTAISLKNSGEDCVQIANKLNATKPAVYNLFQRIKGGK